MQTRLAWFGLLAVFLGSGCDGTTTVDGGIDPFDTIVEPDTGRPLVDAPLMDAALPPTDGGAEPDAALADAGSTTDTGAAADAPAASDAGTLSCASLPACAASKGCGPTLTTACCCGDTVFDPATAIGCCCGFGIVPGATLTCEG